MARVRQLPFCGLVLALMLSACTTAGTQSGSSTLSTQRIHEIVASPDRSAADRTNDVRRRPEQVLAFLQIRAGMTALDISAGRGYTTELLARAVGPAGVVYGQSPARTPAVSPPALAQRSADMQRAGVAAARIIPVVAPFDSPVPGEMATGSLDLVTLMFNYHDLVHLGVDRVRMNLAVFAALKPGGLYVIADHSGRPGTGATETATLHRIEESYLRDEVLAAGFKLQAVGDFLRNPNDPRDQNEPNPPQPKDEFVLRFVKP